MILNKIDLVSPDNLEKIKATLTKLNPTAKLLCTSYSKVDLKEVLNTGLFNFEKAETSPGWLKIMRGEAVPETEEYGISRLTNIECEKLTIIQFCLSSQETIPSQETLGLARTE